MGKTSIEWTQHTWSPVTGCTKISPGCKHCYAERMARRLAGRFGYPAAPGHFDVTLRRDRLEQPLKRKKPTTYFVCSMSDLFHEDVPDRFIFDVFSTIDITPEHTYQVLTKRPGRVLKLMVRGYLVAPLPDNVWLGVSVENQAAADERIPLLLRTPASMRFVSCEPMLEAIILQGGNVPDLPEGPWPDEPLHSREYLRGICGDERVNWVIAGGESGPDARPMHPDWARDIKDQCKAADVPYFHKQNGEYVPADGFNQWGTSLNGKFVNPKLVRAVQTVPGDIPRHMVRVGKKAAGRLLNGRTWDEMPKL